MRPKVFHDIQQNTDEWLSLRLGKVTGSGLSKIMANYGKAFGEPAKEYAIEIALEQITGRPQGVIYTNAHMERGHEQEPIARAMYEDMHFCDVSNGGFFDNGNTGCSPDGLVYDDGVIEIKSVIGKTQFKTVSRGRYDPSYKWQLVFELRETGRDWVDYVSYSSDFPEGKRLFVFRSTKDDFSEEFKMVEERLEQFFKIVEKNKQIINGG
jgi:hypothetical protein